MIIMLFFPQDPPKTAQLHADKYEMEVYSTTRFTPPMKSAYIKGLENILYFKFVTLHSYMTQ